MLFNEAGWSDSGIVLDLEHITKHVYLPLQIAEIDHDNEKVHVLQEISGLVSDHTKHAIIKFS